VPESAEDEMGRIHEEDVTGPGDRGIENRLELRRQEIFLRRHVFGQRLFGGTGTARVRCHLKPKPARKVRV
jgi:hypothetical protein